MHGVFEKSGASSQDSLQRNMVAAPKSLVGLCRSVIVTYLERYPPGALGILDEHEWDNIVQVQYERTKPIKGKGGLDGKGRVNPAISEKFMLELEKSVPILAQSTTVDNLVWKDIVESKYRTGGVSRPRWLLYPWPVLQEVVTGHGKTLERIASMDEIDGDERELCIRTIEAVCEIPMDVSLLKSSGIGKTVTRFLRACSSGRFVEAVETNPTPSAKDSLCNRLEGALHAWKQMAAHGGIQISGFVGDASIDTCCSSLSKARTCMMIKYLYNVVKTSIGHVM